MKKSINIETKLLELKPVLLSKFHVSKIGYFGSYATDRQTDKSDLDLLVEFSEPVGWEFFTLEKFLENEFGMSIDLVTKDALKERTQSSILGQVKYV